MHFLQTFFELFPVRLVRLFGLILTELIINVILDVVGQVLLVDPVVRVIVGIDVVLTLYVAFRAVGMDVLQLPRHYLTEPFSYIFLRRGDRALAGIGLWRETYHDDSVGKRNTRLGKADLHRDIHAGLDDRDDLGIGKSDVLTRAYDKPAARGEQIARLDQPRELEQRRVDD